MPRVTLIASIYNVADCVGRFIQSLNRQTFRDFVVFFVNDGTKDDSFDRIVRDLAEGTALRYIHVDAAGKAFSSDRPAAESTHTFTHSHIHAFSLKTTTRR